MFFTQSQANETLIYKVEPAIVAEACQTALKQVGHVKKVSRETGTIAGAIGFFWYCSRKFSNIPSCGRYRASYSNGGQSRTV